MFYRPHMREGVATLRFALRIDESSNLSVEWRDAARPYRVGPSLRVIGGELKVSGRTLMTLPPDEWIRFEITCGLGEAAMGTYDLLVRPAGGETQRFEDLPCVTEDFARLEWLGFVSLADGPAVFYLDDVKLNVREP